MLHKIRNLAQVGVNKDLSQHELPDNAWTDAGNVRFFDGSARQFLGHRQIYGPPTNTPQHVMPINIAGQRYWIYATAANCYAVTWNGSAYVHTDITHATPRTGVVNQWTGASLSGVPVLNVGDTTHVPMAWDLNTANDFVDLTNWPASTYCKSLRAYKNFLIALNVTKIGTNYPFMVKWSHPAVPGALPSSWDETDATKDAGELDIAEGHDVVVDGGQLRDSFIVYKENSTWRMDFTGGVFVFRLSKVLGTNGILNRNCWVEHEGMHYVLSASDVIAHDGQSGRSLLDKTTRRWLFSQIDTQALDKCFVFKNPYYNEIWFCYPKIGATTCDQAMVYNAVDGTVSFRDAPNLNHAADGGIDPTAAGSWDADTEIWSDDYTFWNQLELVPPSQVCVGASNDGYLYGFDLSAGFDAALPDAFVERRGLSFGSPESIKLIRGIRPRIAGVAGESLSIKVGAADSIDDDPTWLATMTHTIGSTVANDCTVAGRYIAIRFESSGVHAWRLDSYDVDIVGAGGW